jgi:lysophospholipase L1-like esterase
VFRSAGVRFVSYDRDPGIVTEMFLDLDHLTAAGNQALAARIAGDLAAPVSVPRDP